MATLIYLAWWTFTAVALWIVYCICMPLPSEKEMEKEWKKICKEGR